ncbi:ATP-binding cassette domain-containing protein [Paenibacillus ginsengihumi]|uniref:ATP-binding cassette domain-containing protein n=1 Tax=Paenibacillus ginsengihumi TaxID=431596 RepID=UPI00037B328F|nr:ATP-binding cassette domain-containing protein [Paenibacillus ginsengihumi]
MNNRRAGRGISLTVRRAGKRFGELAVLSGIELDIRSGQFVAIVGKSGCGKSTLLRLIAGLDRPSEGELFADGAPVTGLHPDVRLLFQDARLLPWKTAAANVQLGVRSGGKEAALTALRLVGLEHKASEWPGVLSGGQRQRVALARALAGEPRLLLLDEPLGALDALTRIEMQQLIERLWLEQGFTAILVTHDVSEAVALADRVILIEEGAVALDVPVALPRPRQRDHRFARLEQLILDRVMGKDVEPAEASQILEPSSLFV